MLEDFERVKSVIGRPDGSSNAQAEAIREDGCDPMGQMRVEGRCSLKTDGLLKMDAV